MPLHFKPYIKTKSSYQGGKSRKELSRSSGSLIKLSSNENQLGPSPLATAAIQQAIQNLSEYPDRTDHAFRAALSSFYGGALSPEQFITTNSGVANIELIINGFLSEGDECIYSNPAFGPYRGFPPKVGAQAINVPLLGPDFTLDVQGILSAINPRTKLIFITNPNNPTGTHISKDLIDELLAGVPDHVLVVYDEVYYQYTTAEDYTTALPYVLSGKNVIAINSFSKAYGLAGLRIGYSYSTPEVAQYLQQLRRPFMINSISMAAAIAALKDVDFIKKTAQLIAEEKLFLYSELDRLGVRYWKTQANFIMIQPVQDPAYITEAVLQEGIMIRPVTNFGATDCIRVTIGTHEENKAYISALEKAIVASNN